MARYLEISLTFCNRLCVTSDVLHSLPIESRQFTRSHVSFPLTDNSCVQSAPRENSDIFNDRETSSLPNYFLCDSHVTLCTCMSHVCQCYITHMLLYVLVCYSLGYFHAIFTYRKDNGMFKKRFQFLL